MTPWSMMLALSRGRNRLARAWTLCRTTTITSSRRYFARNVRRSRRSTGPSYGDPPDLPRAICPCSTGFPPPTAFGRPRRRAQRRPTRSVRARGWSAVAVDLEELAGGSGAHVVHFYERDQDLV